jgi:cbb3-type cytochrome oxidase maturation protein
MNILLVLIPISFIFLLLAIGIFIWAIRSNQFENLESAALDILATENDADAKVKKTDAD